MKSKYNYISRDFIDMGYTLKKPYKNKGKQEIVVQPGHEEIIVCRVTNGPLKPMKFPPPLDIIFTFHQNQSQTFYRLMNPPQKQCKHNLLL